MNSHGIPTNSLHFVLVPLMAQGHMIPMIDLARLLASRGALVSFITTPVNFARIKPIIDGSLAAGLPIRFVDLPFPTAAAGVPDGCENADLIPSVDLFLPFLRSLSLFRDPLEAHLLAAGGPPPSCVISDNLHPWTAAMARDLGVPRLVFHGTSCFYLMCSRLVHQHRSELESLTSSDSELFALPGLPQTISVTKAQVISTWSTDAEWIKYIDDVRVAEKAADAVVVNSFLELEPWYFENYSKATGKKVWPVGPLSLYKEDLETKAARGRSSAVDKELVLRWLDAQEPRSVLFISFGSIARNTPAQLGEIADGLEAAAGWPFIWALKEAATEAGGWVAKFEERVGDRGLMIKGWAPQAVILGHEAVGGFMTHCGWNSTVEAIAAGVPMATWPHFADQFLNERLVVDVLGMGVAVGEAAPTALVVEKGRTEVKVKREDVERAMVRLMDGGEEGEKRRESEGVGGEGDEGYGRRRFFFYESLNKVIRLVEECYNENKMR